MDIDPSRKRLNGSFCKKTFKEQTNHSNTVFDVYMRLTLSIILPQTKQGPVRIDLVQLTGPSHMNAKLILHT